MPRNKKPFLEFLCVPCALCGLKFLVDYQANDQTHGDTRFVEEALKQVQFVVNGLMNLSCSSTKMKPACDGVGRGAS